MAGHTAPEPASSSGRDDLLHHPLYRGVRVHHVLLMSAFLLLIGLGAFFIIAQNEAVSQTAIASYQHTELEIVRGAARSTSEYVYVQTVILGRKDIQNIEQEVLKKFIEPIHLLKNGDAWIYAPDHVVFDLSSDFPDEYRGKSMAQIFEIQKSAGASHYEKMTEDVTCAREGTGYYIWLPEKGKEIAAWTPVSIGGYTWTIGLSTPLSEILDASGATANAMTSWFIFFTGAVVAHILFVGWLRADIRRGQTEMSLFKTNEKLRLLSSITRHDILNQLTVLRGFLEISRARVSDEPVGGYLQKAQQAAISIERQIVFTRLYQDIGVKSPVWQDVRECVERTVTGLLPASVSCSIDLDRAEIFADPLFEKVIYTLVDNTLRHGGGATAIRFSSRLTATGDLVLRYEDNGTGIRNEEKERIFERGYGKHTGFGLFLAREILSITDLTIRETGEAGRGAVFEITVPKGGYRLPSG